jgi:flagellar assembly protein FliH
MSTSASPGRDARGRPSAQPFLYAEALALPDAPAAPSAGATDREEERARHEAAAREAGRQEGEAQARSAAERELHSVRENMSAALADFAQSRKAYYERVEAEVVRLALNIARKILHREAQIDPLLLAGLVRVALEQLEMGTRVVVHACPAQVSEFRGFFARQMDSAQAPVVEEDATLEPGHCRLETIMGTTEMGLEVQLQEIERGLLDLMAQRPQADA